MHILTNITRWQGADSSRRVLSRTQEYLVNPSNIAEMVVDGTGSRVLFSDNKTMSRDGLSLFWSESSVEDFVDAADQPLPQWELNLTAFRDNNPNKRTYEINIKRDDLILAWEAAENSDHTWMIYQDGERTLKLLVDLKLEEISDDAMKYTDTVDLDAGVNTDVTTTLTRIPYSVQLLDASGNDVSRCLVAITLVGTVYVLTFYSVDELLNCTLYLLY